MFATQRILYADIQLAGYVAILTRGHGPLLQQQSPARTARERYNPPVGAGHTRDCLLATQRIRYADIQLAGYVAILTRGHGPLLQQQSSARNNPRPSQTPVGAGHTRDFLLATQCILYAAIQLAGYVAILTRGHGPRVQQQSPARNNPRPSQTPVEAGHTRDCLLATPCILYADIQLAGYVAILIRGHGPLLQQQSPARTARAHHKPL